MQITRKEVPYKQIKHRNNSLREITHQRRPKYLNVTNLQQVTCLMQNTELLSNSFRAFQIEH